MTNKPKFLILHGTDVSRDKAFSQFLAVNRYHESQDFPKSSLGYFGGYHALIEPDGRTLRYRLDSDEGAHCNQIVDGVSMNLQSLAVCMTGDFDIELPTAPQIESLKDLVQSWQKQYGIPNDRVHFHRDYNTEKTCPGYLLRQEWLNSLLNGPAALEKTESQAEKQAAISQLQGRLDYLRTLLISLLQQLKEQLKGRLA